MYFDHSYIYNDVSQHDMSEDDALSPRPIVTAALETEGEETSSEDVATTFLIKDKVTVSDGCVGTYVCVAACVYGYVR